MCCNECNSQTRRWEGLWYAWGQLPRTAFNSFRVINLFDNFCWPHLRLIYTPECHRWLRWGTNQTIFFLAQLPALFCTPLSKQLCHLWLIAMVSWVMSMPMLTNNLLASLRQPHPDNSPSDSSHSTHLGLPAPSSTLSPSTILPLSSTLNSRHTFSRSPSHHRSSSTHRTAHRASTGLPSRTELIV